MTVQRHLAHLGLHLRSQPGYGTGYEMRICTARQLTLQPVIFETFPAAQEVLYSCDLSTQESEAGGSQVLGLFKLHEILF